jgi:hypothetical protein
VPQPSLTFAKGFASGLEILGYCAKERQAQHEAHACLTTTRKRPLNMHIARRIAFVALAGLTAGTALAQDGMGGFDRPYTNDRNLFGHGAWGDGQGTSIPLPRRDRGFGMSYDQPYNPRSNLFGSGFWAAEYAVRAGGEQGRVSGRAEDVLNSPAGALAATQSKDDHDKGWDKDDHDKPCKKKPCKPEKPEKPKHPPKTVYVPYPVIERVYVPRRSSTVVIIERVKQSDMGRITLTEVQRPQTFSAVCLGGKGDTDGAYIVSDRASHPDYQGEIFRCPGDAMLRVSYATGAASIVGAVQTADGSSYADCDQGEALIRNRGGELICAPAAPLSRQAERSLATRSAQTDSETTLGSAPAAVQQIDLSGMEMTGGVGGL